MSDVIHTSGAATDAFEPRITAFVCNWCTYTGADLAGTSRLHMASNVRIIRLPCTGRIDPLFIIKAFERGADGVIVSGCHPADCHYTSGNYHARRRFAVFRDLGAVRELWRRAPIVMLLALVILYGLSLPLYLFKIVAAPRDAVLFLTPIFILTIYPARLAVGWATHRAQSRPARRWLLLRWPVTAILLPLLALYVFLLFFTPAIDAFGRRALFDHHALLIPTPF